MISLSLLIDVSLKGALLHSLPPASTPGPSTLIGPSHSVLPAGSDSWARCSFARWFSGASLSLVAPFLFTLICSVSERCSESPFSGGAVPRPRFDLQIFHLLSASIRVQQENTKLSKLLEPREFNPGD